MEAKFCPFCQRKNKPDAIRCAHCGVLLIAHQPGAFTTMSVSSPAALQNQEEKDCAGRIEHLPPDSFALFILDFAEPIILKNQPVLVIGRDNPEPNKETVLDMSRYGDLAQGISRQHAQIQYANGDYSIEDLGSTNGTWLNRSRLTPGQTYPLRSDDQVWLGPLKLLFCKGSAHASERVVFSLRLVNTLAAPPRLISPGLLLAEIAPYLRALEQLEEVRTACLQETAKPIYIASIEKTAAYIQVQMDGLHDVAALMGKWVMRWRDEHLEMVNAPDTGEPQWQEQLRPLATRIAEFLQPTLPPGDLTPFIDAFIPPLTRLVTSPFEFNLE
ncbi:MAG: FHA domain-containing protein [Chloroflexi bacterium]|nr:FHA domain-containing protein [Ardenticatenaceae bacterium]MBL1128347.1 FHA domain-containing protein [Chloroflexota bacterium]NOG34422.1 FHA domain-containing protein [Chloroflexota bacterium]